MRNVNVIDIYLIIQYFLSKYLHIEICSINATFTFIEKTAYLMFYQKMFYFLHVIRISSKQWIEKMWSCFQDAIDNIFLATFIVIFFEIERNINWSFRFEIIIPKMIYVQNSLLWCKVCNIKRNTCFIIIIIVLGPLYLAYLQLIKLKVLSILYKPENNH